MATVRWPPEKVPKKFPLTACRDGWCKSFNGKTKFVCGRLPPRQALARYHQRLTAGDFDAAPPPKLSGGPVDQITTKQLCNLYMAWLRQRVETSRPKPMTLRSYDDNRNVLQFFCDVPWVDENENTWRIGNLPAGALGPRQFSAAAARFPGASPFTANRYISTIVAMFNWGTDADHLEHFVKFGPDFKKASAEELDVARADLEKAFKPVEVRKLLQHLHATHRAVSGTDEAARRLRQRAALVTAWTWLGINCAFSNVDVAGLLAGRISRETGTVRFRRGKKGRCERLCPLWPQTLDAIDACSQRPTPGDPKFAGHVFLTPTGQPYVRTKAHHHAESGALTKGTRIDTLGNEFIAVLDGAALRQERRNFSGLRTTFRTIAEAMPHRDDAAIDLIMGHRRKHISRHYVEDFPVEKLHAVVDYVWGQLFEGWSIPLSESPRARSRQNGDPPPAAAA